ncbi:methylenetetrahydrofolate reductase C-terminal domain-containing protein [Xanthobacter sp. V3C-3]|uniref:methylenetetrahydrofolate reductase C-terminal domain-containing protein n=1 Tax=Xanthobacter lutulentifluminis TaxID=3119935 RepID=UPI003727814C
MPATSYKNLIREAIENEIFLYTLEYVPDIKPEDGGDEALRKLRHMAGQVAGDPRVRGFNIGDRVKSLNSFSTVDCGTITAEASGKVPLLHLAGKDRLPSEAREVFACADSLGLTNYLILTGDGVHQPSRPGRVRYQDSVNAIADAKKTLPHCFVAAAVAPFKYREEELMNQYLKMVKKINVGADYIITNCGWDMGKFEELIWYRAQRGLKTPIVANLLLPQWGWAKSIHAGRLPGVHMSDDLFAKLTEERSALGKQAAERLYARLVLQIVGVKLMGYAGVQLSGVDDYESLCRVIEATEALEKQITTLEDWRQAWDEMHTLADGRIVDFGAPGGLYLQHLAAGGPAAEARRDIHPSAEELRKYNVLKATHDLLFDPDAIGTRVIAPLVKALDASPLTRDALRAVEHRFKTSTLGCEMCGTCRIPYLSYICPETCPKGLANGPCAGVQDNVCEFKDRECIHSRKFRLSKEAGTLTDLEEVIIPAVEGTRETSSWANEYNHVTRPAPRVPSRAACAVVAPNVTDYCFEKDKGPRGSGESAIERGPKVLEERYGKC